VPDAGSLGRFIGSVTVLFFALNTFFVFNRSEQRNLVVAVSNTSAPTAIPADGRYRSMTVKPRQLAPTMPMTQRSLYWEQKGLLQNATPELLATIPGIGDSVGQLIFRRVHEGSIQNWRQLQGIRGVGAATIRRLKHYFVLEQTSG